MAAHSTLVATVQSSSTGERYDIKRDDINGNLWCGCPGWKFSRAVPKSCKHVRAYLADPETVKANGLTVPTPSPHVITQQVVETIKAAKAAARSGAQPSLADTLLDMAKQMERGQQIAVSVIVAKMREAAEALQRGVPLAPPPMPTFQPIIGQTRVIMID